MGGDRCSGQIEAQVDFLLAHADEKDDITHAEMQRRLTKERVLKVGIGTLSRFFDRHDVTWKQRPPMQASRTGRTS